MQEAFLQVIRHSGMMHTERVYLLYCRALDNRHNQILAHNAPLVKSSSTLAHEGMSFAALDLVNLYAIA